MTHYLSSHLFQLLNNDTDSNNICDSIDNAIVNNSNSNQQHSNNKHHSQQHQHKHPTHQYIPTNIEHHTTIPYKLIQQYNQIFTINIQKQFNYTINNLNLPDYVQKRIIELTCDTETVTFLQQCCNDYKSSYISLHYIKSMLFKPIYALYYSHTDVNALLNTGNMFVFSKQQLHILLDKYITQLRQTYNNICLLDIGAGSGNVTAQFATLVDTIYVNEVSQYMIQVLQTKQYIAYTYSSTDVKYIINDMQQRSKQQQSSPHIISILNVLDRCNEPLTLLKQIYQYTNYDTILLIALVLPYKPYVENNDGSWTEPTEQLIDNKYNICCASFEDSIQLLFEHVFSVIGYDILTVSRLPYISAGDNVKPFYVLQDAVFVLRKKPL